MSAQPVRRTGRAVGAGPWFVVLPDSDAARPVADQVRARADHELRHPSGRPFVLGQWDKDTVSSQGGTVTIGSTGGAHVVTSANGRVRVRGTASGICRVFHARVNGITIAADRADTLAVLAGAEPDPTGLALRLLSPTAPWPLTWHSVWTGVTSVPPGHWLNLDSEVHERWWTHPEAELSLADAAGALRGALDTAVRNRLQGKEKVACDVSGLDSSSLFALAARAGGRVVALTYEADDPMDEDVAASQYLVEVFQTDHDVLRSAAAPLPFQGMLDDPGPLDEPTWVSGYRARIGTASSRAASHHAELRFAGHGGDELLMPPPAWLADIARRHPLRAARLARRLQAKYRLPASALAGLVADRTPYSEWLGTSLNRAQPSEWQVMSWGIPPTLPTWVTADATELVRDAISRAQVEPLAASRGMHATLELVHTGAMAARHVAQLGAADGVPVALPYYDDQVLEACLAVRPEEAIDPRRYKPQLVMALADVLPPRTLARTSKSEISMTVGRGWQTHRSVLLELLDDSELARLGLIDVAAVRRIVTGPYHADSCGPVRQALELEAWLRSKGSR